nr:peptide MFS transporter [Bacteroidota bacterium]
MASTSRHPKGLPFLFFSEMWERFGFYLLLAIFTLFLKDTVDKGGKGMDSAQASDLYGTFLGLIYLTPFIGGLLADRVLGYRSSVTIGGALMGFGYMALAIPGEVAFYSALLLIILGNGFFKPNISTLLGNIYNEEQYLRYKDSGYNIFYMGINLGAFISPFFAAYLRNEYGWGYAFIAAGIGMFLGLIVFWMGNKHYAHADVRKPARPGDMGVGKILGIVMLPAILCGILAYVILPPDQSIFGTKSTDAFLFGAIPVVIYYIYLWRSASEDEKRPIAGLLAIMGVAIIFWAIFKQNGTALTYWADYFTDREVPAVLLTPAQSIGMVQEVSTMPDSVSVFDELFRTQKRPDGKVLNTYGPHYYFNNLPPEETQPTGAGTYVTKKLISTELFQSVNPFFVIVLTPVVVAFWSFLRRKKREPSTPAKIGWGMVITALSTLVMVGAVAAAHNGADKASAWWLISTYAVVT